MAISSTNLAFHTATTASGLLSFLAIACLSRAQEPRRNLRKGLLAASMCAVLAMSPACVAYADSTPTRAIAKRDSYANFIAEASQRFGIPVTWLHAVIQVESGGNARAVSPKGAMGLMQLMPNTWSDLCARYRLGSDPFDPHDNILAGAAYLRELFDRFSASGFLAAYNAGPKRFQDYLSGLRPLNDETRHYLETLARMLPELPIGPSNPAVARTDDWRTASLFASASTASSLSGNAPYGPSLHSTFASRSSALTSQSDGLFVPVQTTEQR